MHTDHVGVHAETSADVAIDVSVGVDHAGKHQPSANVNGLLGGGRQNVLLYGSDLAVADCDVHHAVDVGRGTNNVSAAKQQIIGFVIGHGRSPSSVVRWLRFHQVYARAFGYFQHGCSPLRARFVGIILD